MNRHVEKLLKEEIRKQLGESATDELVEGMFDRIKAKAKGAVASVKGAASAAKDKVMGKGEKGQSMKDAMKQGASGVKQKAIVKQTTGTFLKKVGSELGSVQKDFTKLLNLKSKDFDGFIKEMGEIHPETAKMINGIFRVSESLKQKLSNSTK